MCLPTTTMLLLAALIATAQTITNYNVQLPENEIVDNLITLGSANRFERFRFAALNYHKPTEIDHFRVNPETGVLSCVKPIDFEQISQIRLILEQTYTSNKSTQLVYVHVQVQNRFDTPPIHSWTLADLAMPHQETPKLMNLSLTEFPAKQTLLATLILTPIDLVPFEIRVQNSSSSIFDVQKLDSSTLAIIANDNNRSASNQVDVYADNLFVCSLVARVVPAERISSKKRRTHNDPNFVRSFHFSVQENEGNALIGHLTLPNSTHNPLQFHLNTNHELFDLDKSSGLLRTKQPLDREKSINHQLDVVITNPDFSLIEHTKIYVEVIDQNDNQPVFVRPSPNETIEVNQSTGIVSEIQVFDADAGQNALVRVELDPHPYFNLHKNNLYSRGAPQGTHCLKLTASDMGSPTQTTTIKVFCRVQSSGTMKGALMAYGRIPAYDQMIRTYTACTILTLMLMLAICLAVLGCLRQANNPMVTAICLGKSQSRPSISPIMSSTQSDDKNSLYGYVPVTTLQKYSVV